MANRMNQAHKLYCYVDETGQDTKGTFFIVAVVITDERRPLEAYLESAEVITGKKTKWMKTSDTVRQAYIRTLAEEIFPGMIFVKNYRSDILNFDEPEVLATAQALNLYREQHRIAENRYKATITIDGLSKTMAVRIGSELRKLGVKTRKVVGSRDEASAIVRLADAIAGLVREAQEGRMEYKKLKSKLGRNGKLHDL